MSGYWVLFLFAVVGATLLAGYPVAVSLAGAALAVAGAGLLAGVFDPAFLQAIPNRLYGIVANPVLTAVPLFVFMGVVLERARIAERLLQTMAGLFGRSHAGLGVSVVLVGMVLAASTGIIGATVIAMGLLSLPVMLQRGYSPALSAGTICASGTLGQLIPPSIVLVLLGDVISASYQQAQLQQGQFAPQPVAVSDLFAGALLPGLLLVAGYILYLLWTLRRPRAKAATPAPRPSWRDVSTAVLPPLVLIVVVLGSILAGIATPTEAAAMGAGGALLIAMAQRRLTMARLRDVMRSSLRITTMVFFIVMGASIFALVFRGFEGDEWVRQLLSDLPGGAAGAMLVVMGLMFVLGFVLDFIEITFVVVPIVAPVLLGLGLDPIWLGVMIAVNLQTSFLTPPFGFALFYLRGVAPAELRTEDIYRGVMPFVVIQIMALALLALFPELTTWLPALLR